MVGESVELVKKKKKKVLDYVLFSFTPLSGDTPERLRILLSGVSGHLLWNSFENRKRTISGRKINHQSYGPETGDFFG